MVWSDYWEYKNIKWPTHPKFTKADKNSQRKIGANGISQIAKICWKKWETAMKNTYTQKQKKPANFSPKLKYTKKAKKNLPHFPPDPIDTKIKKDYIFWFHAIFFCIGQTVILITVKQINGISPRMLSIFGCSRPGFAECFENLRHTFQCIHCGLMRDKEFYKVPGLGTQNCQKYCISKKSCENGKSKTPEVKFFIVRGSGNPQMVFSFMAATFVRC